MGLLDSLLGGKSTENIQLDSREAFAGVLLVTVAADGHISDEEAQNFSAVVNRMQLFREQSGSNFSAMVDKLLGLQKKHGHEFLLKKSTESLPCELRETAFAVATDLVFADGSIEDEERDLIDTLRQSLNISDEMAVKIVEVMSIKNKG